MSGEREFVPHSVEAEQSVLGGLLLDNDSFDKVAGRIAEQDFYRRDHRLIWNAILRLITKGHRADVITVFELLQAERNDDDAGGLAYLNGLAQNTPSAAGIRSYAQIVKDRAMRRTLMTLADEAHSLASQTSGMTAAQIAAQYEEKVFHVTERAIHVDAELPKVAEIIPSLKADIQERMERGGPAWGMRTGLRELDLKTLGFFPGQLIIIAGRPSMGKTALALQIAEHASTMEGEVGVVFEMEMTAKQLTSRMIANRAEIDMMDIRRGTLDQYALKRWQDAESRLMEADLYIEERPALTVAQMRAIARRAKRQAGSLGYAVVDHIGLATGMGEKRHEQIGSITKGLKAMAKELNIPVIALCQINRAVDRQMNKRPVMADLKESGSVEEDADIVLFLYREEFYNPDTPNTGVTEVIIGKNRDGPSGTLYTAFEGRFTRFSDMDRNWQPLQLGVGETSSFDDLKDKRSHMKGSPE